MKLGDVNLSEWIDSVLRGEKDELYLAPSITFLSDLESRRVDVDDKYKWATVNRDDIGKLFWYYMSKVYGEFSRMGMARFISKRFLCNHGDAVRQEDKVEVEVDGMFYRFNAKKCEEGNVAALLSFFDELTGGDGFKLFKYWRERFEKLFYRKVSMTSVFYVLDNVFALWVRRQLHNEYRDVEVDVPQFVDAVGKYTLFEFPTEGVTYVKNGFFRGDGSFVVLRSSWSKSDGVVVTDVKDSEVDGVQVLTGSKYSWEIVLTPETVRRGFLGRRDALFTGYAVDGVLSRAVTVRGGKRMVVDYVYDDESEYLFTGILYSKKHDRLNRMFKHVWRIDGNTTTGVIADTGERGIPVRYEFLNKSDDWSLGIFSEVVLRGPFGRLFLYNPVYDKMVEVNRLVEDFPFDALENDTYLDVATAIVSASYEYVWGNVYARMRRLNAKGIPVILALKRGSVTVLYANNYVPRVFIDGEFNVKGDLEAHAFVLGALDGEYFLLPEERRLFERVSSDPKLFEEAVKLGALPGFPVKRVSLGELAEVEASNGVVDDELVAFMDAVGLRELQNPTPGRWLVSFSSF